MQTFSQQELQQLEKAVLHAELKTSGEIVPIIIHKTVPPIIYKYLPKNFVHFNTRYQARKQFSKLGIHKTTGKTGILIAVFLQERRVEVVADKGISKYYPQSTWVELVNTITQAAKKDKLVVGICEAIARCGTILGKYCPRQMNDVNELHDRLRILP